jgi:hypothetical protein
MLTYFNQILANRSSVNRGVACGQTDGHDETISPISQFLYKALCAPYSVFNNLWDVIIL